MTLLPKIEAEYRKAEIAGDTHEIVHERDVEAATSRVLKRIALGTFTDDLYDRIKSPDVFLEDIRNDAFEDKVYFQDVIKHLSPEQFSQLITYFAMTPLTIHHRSTRVFVRLYDPEADGFRLEELPQADAIKPAPKPTES